MKKKLYYSERVRLENTFLGIAQIAAGIFSLFECFASLVVMIVSVVFCTYVGIRVLLANTEAADEMAERNIRRAKALASDYMQIFYCCLAILAILLLRNVELSIGLNKIVPSIVFLTLGINHVIVGFAFRKFEDE